MSLLKYISTNENEYKQFKDYVFKKTVEKRVNGLLRFVGIPYEIHDIFISEITDFGPKLRRLDFVGEAEKDSQNITLILECQSMIPTDEDIKRFFQYVASMRILKNNTVELYIICTENVPYTVREFEIKEDCIYTMHVISLKNYKAKEILKNVENKIENKEEVSDDDIAALQLIAFTDYDEPILELLIKTNELIGKLDIEKNEKDAIFYIMEVLSANMLDQDDRNRYSEVTTMMLNPRDEYLFQKGKKEGIEEGRKEGFEEGFEKGFEEGKNQKR